MNRSHAPSKSLRWLAKVLVLALSTYITLLIIQIVWHGIMTRSHPPAMFRDSCPPAEHLRLTNDFENMGPGLLRRPDVGWYYWPGVSGNSKGYLGDSRPYHKPHGTWRVVLLGDSFTGSTHVPYSFTFADRLEKELQKRYPERRIEVINLGVGGYGIDQEYFSLLCEGYKYNPDLVIHGIFLGNDINDVSYKLYNMSEYPVHRTHPIKRYVSLTESNTLAILDPDLHYYFRRNVTERLSRNPWSLSMDDRTFMAKFEWDEDLAMLKGRVFPPDSQQESDVIDNIRFTDVPLFELHLKQAGQWIRLTSLKTARLEWDEERAILKGTIIHSDGRETVDEIDQLWMDKDSPFQLHLKQTNRWIHMTDLKPILRDKKHNAFKAAILRSLLLADLRQLIVRRFLDMNYSWGKFLIKHHLIREDEAPVFVKLLEFQGQYPVNYQVFFRTYNNPEWKKAWEVSFRLISETRSYTTNTLHVPYMACLFPSMEMVYPDYWAKVRQAYPELDKVADAMDVTKPVAMMNDFLATNGIPCLSFYELMKDYHRQQPRKLYSLQHAHFNEDGHAFVASNIVQFITDRSWTPR